MILETLRPGHPRIIAVESDMDRSKGLIERDPIARAVRDRLREAAVRILDAPPVERKLIGPRLLGQSRLCLERVYTLAMLYRLEGDPRFAERAREEMLAAAAFEDWNPSHFLDTAEMTHALAIGYDWLFSFLDDRTRATVRRAIVEKGLNPAVRCYQDRDRWVMSPYNWSQVCNGGIGIGALAIADEQPDLAEYILARALVSIIRPMETYAPDGGWDEGPGYWHYATRYNVYFLAALESALGTDFGLSQMPGFSRTGDFRVYFIGPLGRAFNYADATEETGGGDEPKEGAAEMFWLARKFHNPLYAWHQHQYLESPHALDLVWFDPHVRSPEATGLPLDALFRKTDAAFFRSAWGDEDAIFLGFKGGDLRASHSHLDLGSFVLDALGHRWAVDLGRDDYNLPGYFGDRRWTYYRMRTESHNTLLIDDQNQDVEAKAPITQFVSTPQRAFAIANLSEAYPMTRSVRRGVALLERGHIVVQDEVVADHPVDVLWGMLTPAQTACEGRSALLKQEGAHLRARIVEPNDATFEVLEASPPEPQAQNPGIHKLVVRLARAVTEVRIVVVLTPFKEGTEASEVALEVRPLALWE